MPYAKPEFSLSRVARSGETLRKDTPGTKFSSDLVLAWIVLDNWRASHAFPLNTITVSLKARARQADQEALVVQRLKRAESIVSKLRREEGMALSRMQDIGGCRAVVSQIEQVEHVVSLLRQTRWKHKLARERDYIERPKPSGYRGVHLIYRYTSDRNEIYNKMHVEIQIRSAIQHAWATAVETVGTFLQMSLKASQGSDEWLEFFKYASSAFSIIEGRQRLHRDISEGDILRTLREYSTHLNVRAVLLHYTSAIEYIGEQKKAAFRYFILELRAGERVTAVHAFRDSELDLATRLYSKWEQERGVEEGYQVVLVSADSVTSLRAAYPNYFLDTKAFLAHLDEALGMFAD